MSAPIFIVGANRSGTTLLRLLLNAHSRIGIPDEIVYFSSKLAGAFLPNWRLPGLSSDQYRTFVDRFLAANEEVFSSLDTDELRSSILNSTRFDLRRPYELALEAWASSHGKVRWGEKTPGNVFYAASIISMFPEGRFLYMMRDPRAGVNSMINTRLFARDVVINALNRRKYVTQGLGLLERVVPSRQLHLIRYEDLVAGPETTAKEICAFLDEPFEDDMLRFYRSSSAYMKRRSVKEFNDKATRPIDHSRAAAWKDALSPREVAVVESICRSEMQRFGYGFEGNQLNTGAQWEVMLKTMYWNLQSWRNRSTPGYLVKYVPLQRSRRRMKRFVHWRSAGAG